jgi:hypothetical protein
MVATVLLALVVVFLFRWQLHVAEKAVFRIDHWTGNVVRCSIDNDKAACDRAARRSLRISADEARSLRANRTPTAMKIAGPIR